MQNVNNRKLLLVIIIVFSFITGCFIGTKIDAHRVYRLPGNIGVTGVTFRLNENKLSCAFVPEIYSNKLSYEVIVVDCDDNSQKEYMVNIENGEGNIIAYIKNSHTYKFILIISNGEETRNITFANEVFVNLDENHISVR